MAQKWVDRLVKKSGLNYSDYAQGVNMKKMMIIIIFGGFLCSFAFAEKLVEFPKLMKPTSIQFEGNKIYITEGYRFLIYDAENYKLKKEIGAKGEGPGEFNMEIQVKPMPEAYLVASPFKFCIFSREGKFIKEKNITGARDIFPLKDKFVLIRERVDRNNKKVIRAAFLFNDKFESIRRISSADFDVNVRAFGEKPKIILHYLGFQTYKDKLFMADSQKGFTICVFDANGNPLYTIDKPIEKLKTSSRYKKKIMDEFKISNRNVYESYKASGYQFHEYMPAIRYFYINNDRIYVVTYKEKGDRHQLIVMDLKGKILQSIFVPLKSFEIRKSIFDSILYTFHNGNIFELYENPDTETWELHKTKIQ